MVTPTLTQRLDDWLERLLTRHPFCAVYVAVSAIVIMFLGAHPW